MISSRLYIASDRPTWNKFNETARNGHFLFDRGFMEYHSDRFLDHSMMIWEQDTLLALLPANRKEDSIYSHQGLTFGGLILHENAKAKTALTLFLVILDHLRREGIKKVVYKAIPWIYHDRPSQEDLYALFRVNARRIRCDVTTTIDNESPGRRSSRRVRGVKRCAGGGLSFSRSTRWREYWDLLARMLAERHATRPTHSLNEITLLAERFPECIRLFVAERDAEIIAGAVIFETRTVAHAQYIAAGEIGRQTAALDGLFDYLIEHYKEHKHYFDFGISTEQGGPILNEGLVAYKEEFGGGTVVHETYEIDV